MNRFEVTVIHFKPEEFNTVANPVILYEYLCFRTPVV